MSELIRNPRIMKKAQEEVRRIVREKGKLKLDEEDIQEMDYLKDPDTWSCAEEFIPERFIGSKFDFKGLDFEYFPFGSGRRICPGISFGSAVVELVLANLLFWFDWQMPGGADEKGLNMTDSFQTLGAREFSQPPPGEHIYQSHNNLSEHIN
ncbi:hypothetical protein Sjap_013251 [Stephania japonica]|uniref:Cytochrome P450 n=1 Tax=Stephania japonica TaxID=461633 RepID=A0AAP0IXJ6_9MAGN